MKLYDKVKVTSDKYEKQNIHLGEIGTIFDPLILHNKFTCIFDNNSDTDWYKYCDIDINDLELIKSSDATEKMMLEEFPSPNKSFWCIVEDGFIKNLKGEKKNKIAYDYDS